MVLYHYLWWVWVERRLFKIHYAGVVLIIIPDLNAEFLFYKMVTRHQAFCMPHFVVWGTFTRPIIGGSVGKGYVRATIYACIKPVLRLRLKTKKQHKKRKQQFFHNIR